jgi:hypothetical protein
MIEAFPRAFERMASVVEKKGDVVRAAELRERAARARAARPMSGPLSTMPAGARPRGEAEALLDRAMSILEDIRRDIAHPHASRTPGDDTLLGRIDALRSQVDAWKVDR